MPKFSGKKPNNWLALDHVGAANGADPVRGAATLGPSIPKLLGGVAAEGSCGPAPKCQAPLMQPCYTLTTPCLQTHHLAPSAQEPGAGLTTKVFPAVVGQQPQ